MVDKKKILKLASYALAGVTLLCLVATNPLQVGSIALAAGLYFIADRVL